MTDYPKANDPVAVVIPDKALTRTENELLDICIKCYTSALRDRRQMLAGDLPDGVLPRRVLRRAYRAGIVVGVN